jgi:hypothetical protein
MKKVYLSAYRFFGFSFLFGISATILSFFFLMLFFLANSSWIAPTILAPTSDRMLTFANAYQQALQNVEALRAQKHSAEVEYATALLKYRGYAALQAGLGDGHRTMKRLEGQTHNDLRQSATLSRQLDRNRDQIERSLKAGLITSADAAGQLAAAQSFDNSLTGSQVSITSASLAGQTSLTQARVNAEEARASIEIKAKELELSEKVLASAETQLRRLEASSYYRAMAGNGANLAFVPYENRNKVSVGDPVFACRLLLIACRKIGTVKEILDDEQTVEFPIFNVRFSRTMRGTFAVLDIASEEQDSMRDKLFFVNSKPLLF